MFALLTVFAHLTVSVIRGRCNLARMFIIGGCVFDVTIVSLGTVVPCICFASAATYESMRVYAGPMGACLGPQAATLTRSMRVCIAECTRVDRCDPRAHCSVLTRWPPTGRRPSPPASSTCLRIPSGEDTNLKYRTGLYFFQQSHCYFEHFRLTERYHRHRHLPPVDIYLHRTG